jgi:hypothetical protein
MSAKEFKNRCPNGSAIGEYGWRPALPEWLVALDCRESNNPVKDETYTRFPNPKRSGSVSYVTVVLDLHILRRRVGLWCSSRLLEWCNSRAVFIEIMIARSINSVSNAISL